jgi:peptide/nickel transport system permease protein
MATISSFVNYVRRNPSLGWGLGILLGLLLFTLVGRLFVDEKDADALAVPVNLPPSREYPFGTESQGKDLLASMVLGTGMTLTIGAIAGTIGLGIGTFLGFITGYYAGSVLDSVVTSIVDIVLTMPGFLILILIASTLTDPSELKVLQMGMIASITAWAFPTRTIRSQVLTMRERPFVMMAKLSGMKGPEIIVKELMPNLLPYLAMSLAGSVYGGVMASLGLEGLGIGNRRQPTLGMTLYWVRHYSAFLRGMWWWILEPVSVIVLLLTSLTLISFGLDEVANPRVRRRA